ncbi:WD40 repeat domain-containing protein [Streptomyces sp. NPDC048269]|uniref:WD40 repeat domain-containing protein n=1 Tax=Streptomyces sp. NPDC048269 TaxID=3155753 RepID=UPI0034403E68
MEPQLPRQPPRTFEEELAALAADLHRLRIARGKPSYRDLVTRAARSGSGIQLSPATQSEAFNGKRLVRADTLMGLVRILYAYDEYGHDGPVRHVAFTPDGSLLVSGGMDGVLRRWIVGRV